MKIIAIILILFGAFLLTPFFVMTVDAVFWVLGNSITSIEWTKNVVAVTMGLAVTGVVVLGIGAAFSEECL